MAPFLNLTTIVSSAVAIGKMVANVNVLVTGFGVSVPIPDASGSFSERPLTTLREPRPNPSYETMFQTPNIIIDDDGWSPDVQIHKYPEPVRVSYDGVSPLVPELYGSYPNFGLFSVTKSTDGITFYRNPLDTERERCDGIRWNPKAHHGSPCDARNSEIRNSIAERIAL